MVLADRCTRPCADETLITARGRACSSIAISSGCFSSTSCAYVRATDCLISTHRAGDRSIAIPSVAGALALTAIELAFAGCNIEGGSRRSPNQSLRTKRIANRETTSRRWS